MLYATLKAVHLLSVVAWVGGMFFTLMCLRPALSVLESPSRLRLMAKVFDRFFAVVNVAIGLILVSGLWMIWLAYRAAAEPGLAFNVPLDWYVMIALGIVMFSLFGHIRGRFLARLRKAVDAQDWPAGGALLQQIRVRVGVNLALGIVVIWVMKVGAAS